jgi:tRNA 2-selenouridine synthase SelU
MLRIQLEAQEAAARLEEERRRALAQALSLAFEQRVERYQLAIIEDYLVLRCPRCLKAFLDYDACDALTCGNYGCGFCALCLQGQCTSPPVISPPAASVHTAVSGLYVY